MTDALRGFAGLRTESVAPLVIPAAPKRRCAKCNAVLNSGNRTDLCGPCTLGEVEIPDWMIALADCDSRAIDTLACLLTGEPRKHDSFHAAPARRERVRAMYATGNYSWAELAELCEVSKSTIQHYVNGEPRKSHHKKKDTKKAALVSGPLAL